MLGAEAMAAPPRIELELPPDLYARVRDAAARSGRPVEALVIESLDLLFGASSADDGAQLGPTMDTLTDAQLWALVYRRLAWPEDVRLRELTARGKQGALTDDEQAELAALIARADRLTLVRSRALLLLQERGYNVRDHLRLGA